MHEFIQKLLNIPAESQTLEFKRLDGGKVVDKIVETVVAMANTDGGLIVIGIDDPEKTLNKGLERIFGIEENLDLFDTIGRELQFVVPPLSNIWPPEKIQIEEINKTVALIYVPKVTDGFRTKNKKVYIRQERSNLLLNPQEIIKFAYAKGFERADKEIVDVQLELLDTDIYRLWKNARKLDYVDISETLLKTGLAKKRK